MELTAVQEQAIIAEGSSFLLAPAGSGKTTTLHHRLLHLLQQGEPAYTILVLVAEDEQREDFLDFLHQNDVGPYADLKITTYTYMAREMVTLFWPLVARPAGFAKPFQPPTPLTYDLAQLLMWQQITPLLENGAFADLRLRPQQIVSQLIDTLNRAALSGLSLDQAIERTIKTWSGLNDDLRHLHEAKTAARTFREHCRQNNLLDLSLTIRTFDTQLVHHQEFHRYFSERYRHMIVDNVEEQTPAGQNFIAELMNKTVSTTIAYDAGGGYKRFLSADPLNANQFHTLSQNTFHFDHSFTTTEPLDHLANLVENDLILGGTKKPSNRAGEAIIARIQGRYRHEMIAQLPHVLRELIDDHDVHPRDIALVTPYLDGALRYGIEQAFQQANIPYYLLRRRSSPRDEPRIRAWLTWLALAHPNWGIVPSPYDVTEALTLSIAGLDPARAQLITEALYRPEIPALLTVLELSERVEQRTGRGIASLVEQLRQWLAEHGGDYPLDTFLHRLFNDLLAQPPYQPTPDVAGAAVCDWLVRTASKLRQASPALGLTSPDEMGRAFINGINQGLVTADPPELGEPPDLNGVMISTVYGFVLSGRTAHVQIWLESAATGWWDIPRQPLSNVFVLNQSWPEDRLWTMDQDFKTRNQLLARIIRGLTTRCTGNIILANSDLDRRGQRQDSPLWRALQPALT